jgi:hypothetical protein
MDIPTHAELVERIEAFLARHAMAVTRLGREVNGDPNLIPNIRDGRQPNLDTLNKLAAVMAAHDAAPSAGEVKPDWPIEATGKGDNLSGAEPRSAAA